MAKKKQTTRRRKAAPKKQQSIEHSMPPGFWQQVGAVGMIAFAVLLVVAWFNAGGPVLNFLNTAVLAVIGYAAYVLPIVLVYLAIQVFRSETYRAPVVVQISAVLFIVFVAGMSGLMGGSESAGFMGDVANNGMRALVSDGVGIFIYFLLIAVTVLFMFRISPITLAQSLWKTIKSEQGDVLVNRQIMKKAEEEPTEEKSSRAGISKEFVVNTGVPTTDEEERPAKKKKKLTSMVGAAAGTSSQAAESKIALVLPTDPNWEMPSLELLEKKQKAADPGNIEENVETIRDTFEQFGFNVEMTGANVGPKVTQYTLSPPSGVKLTKITALETNLALSLAADTLRMEAPIPGQKLVGIEVPNKRAADVRLRGILSSKQWKTSTDQLAFAIGRDISGDAVVENLAKTPHLLIAGQTGSGKSVMINALLTSLLYRNSPSDMKLILVDPKQVEMAPYEDIPHLLTPVINDPEKTVSALKWAVNEMERRYKALSEEKVREIRSYNKLIKKRGKNVQVEDSDGNMQTVDEGTMPYIVIVIDELADLMMVAQKDVEVLIARLAQKARAVGIHLVLATQRPSVNVITGVIKANVPSRIAFTVSSNVDSRTILDQVGAEKLLGMGDMLIKMTGNNKSRRVQGAFVSDEEVLEITDHLRTQSEPQYNNDIISQPVQIGKGGVVMDNDSSSDDSMFDDAVQVALNDRKISTSHLQRRLRIGYGRASRIVDEMEERGIIGPANGSKPREILISSMSDLHGGDDSEAT